MGDRHISKGPIQGWTQSAAFNLLAYGHLLNLWSKCIPCFCEQVNPELKSHFDEKGFRFVGQDVEGERMEVIELDGTEKQTELFSVLIYQPFLWNLQQTLFKIVFSTSRSPIFCWCAVPSWVHFTPHQAITPLPWFVACCCWEAAELLAERLPSISTVNRVYVSVYSFSKGMHTNWDCFCATQGHIQRSERQQHTRLWDIRTETSFTLQWMTHLWKIF